MELEDGDGQAVAEPTTVRMVSVGGAEYVCRVLDIGHDKDVRLQWGPQGSGINLSLNTGRFRGGKLCRKWRMHPDDLQLCREYARSRGVRLRYSGVATLPAVWGERATKPRKAKPADPRQMGFGDIDGE